MSYLNALNVFVLMAILSFSSTVYAEQQWEYLAKTYPLMGNDQGLTQLLNKLARERWVLVNCTEGDAQLTCIFKRSRKDS